MTKPYQSAETKKRQVQTMFDGIADHYDLLNRMLSFGIDRGWRRRTVDRVVRLHPTEILDMATGTGDLAIQLARRIPQAHVTGVDLSEGMLSIGKEKAQKKGLSDRIDFVSGDAESAAYGTERFDVATVAFGVRNFENIPAGIAGLFRALKPGGHLFVLEFGMPQKGWFGACYNFYFRQVLPRVGGWISKDKAAYTYLPDSVREFPYGERFVKLLHAGGFRNGGFRNLSGGIAQIYWAEKPLVETAGKEK